MFKFIKPLQAPIALLRFSPLIRWHIWLLTASSRPTAHESPGGDLGDPPPLRKSYTKEDDMFPNEKAAVAAAAHFSPFVGQISVYPLYAPRAEMQALSQPKSKISQKTRRFHLFSKGVSGILITMRPSLLVSY